MIGDDKNLLVKGVGMDGNERKSIHKKLSNTNFWLIKNTKHTYYFVCLLPSLRNHQIFTVFHPTKIWITITFEYTDTMNWKPILEIFRSLEFPSLSVYLLQSTGPWYWK